MRVVRQLVDFCLAEWLLTNQDLQALEQMGLVGADDCPNYSYDDAAYSAEPWECACGDGYCNGARCRKLPVACSLDDYQDRLASEAVQRPGKTGRVGQARKRWWKGYQVTQVAKARRRAGEKS